MAANGQQLIDGFTTLSGGVDSGLPADLVPRNKVSFGVNCSFRGGFVGPRPCFVKRALVWPGDQGTTQSRFQSGKFQAAGCRGGAGDNFYTPIAGASYIPVAISGRIFLINLSDFGVRDISLSDLNPPDLDQGWFCQAEQYLLYQDGVTKPFIYNGATARRSNAGKSELPVGTCMGYGLGRLVVALPGALGRRYVAGDIVGGGTEVIDFTENTFLSEGGSFSTLFQTGDITGFAWPVNLNSALGQSLLSVYTPKGVYFNVLPFDRTIWKSLSTPIQAVALLNSGSLSPCITNVNSDQWFRRRDGEASLGASIRNFGDWGDTPQSMEMDRILLNDTQHLLKFGSNVLFDNRLLQTCTPISTADGSVRDRGCFHRGIAALDFSLLGSLQGKQPPCWEGLWTGLNVFSIVQGEFNDQSRCFFLTLSKPDSNNTQTIDLWELLMDDQATADNDGTADVPIQWWFEGPKYGFQVPKQFKQLMEGIIWLAEIEGTLGVTAQYRHDKMPVWQDWASFSECATIRDCTLVNGCLPQSPLQPQSRYFVELPQPADICDEAVGYPHRAGFLFQPLLAFTGFARISGFDLAANPLPPPIRRPCRTTEPCKSVRTCSQDVYSYRL